MPTKAGWEAYDLEIYINNVHDEHMIGPFCGFDQWIDNHIAIDAGPGEVRFFLEKSEIAFGWNQDGTGPTIDKLLPLLEKGGYHYHIWGGIHPIISTRFFLLLLVT